ncbi:MAG TPA: hypothetical protein VLA34_13295 [Candidatus Krumholzibacterium sp.]|nr:hypothetical protein [Candidatus Krumholzibacterium sp.]
MMAGKTTGILVLFIGLALCASAASAQSIFSLNFLGQHLSAGDARGSALGYSSLAVVDTLSAIPANKASLSWINSITLSLYEVSSISRVNTETETSNQNRFMLPSAHLVVPIREGLVAGIGFNTRFAGRGEMTFVRDFDYSPVPKELYETNISLYSVPVSLSWRPADWISFSGEVQIEKGSTKDEVYVYFEEPLFASMSSIRTRGFSGTSWGVSMLMRVHPRFFVGAAFDDGVDYTVEETREYSLSRLDTVFTYDFELPPAWSAGIAVGLSDRWWLSSSFWMREAPDPVGFENLRGDLSDQTVLSFGLERRRSGEGGKIAKMPLRFGYYEDRWHLEFPSGEQIVSRFFTVGSGFGMPGGPGRIDYTLEFGKTGSVSSNRVDEKTFRLGISMSLSERWSKRKVERH